MCNEIYTLYRGCQHKEYQNTYECHIAKRCNPGHETLGGMPALVPKSRPDKPAGSRECRVLHPVRPKEGLCPSCQRGNRSTAAQRISSPSPDGKAVERVRLSLIRVTEEQGAARESPQQSGAGAGGTCGRSRLLLG